MKTDPKKIAIYLTNKCNLKCKHCFIEGSPLNTQFLSLNQIKTALNYYSNQEFSHVDFSGGEACYSPFLVDAVNYARSIGYTVSINTNGTNPQILDTFSPKILEKVTFSLDGAKAKTHNLLRGHGVFQLCLKNIKKSIKMGFNTEAIYTVNSFNINEIPDVVKLLDRIGVSRLSFNFTNETGTAIHFKKFLISPKRWLEAKKIIEKNCQTKQIKLRYPILFLNSSQKTKDVLKKSKYHCILLEPIKIDIYPDGKIYHCCLLTSRPELSAGTVTDDRVILRPAIQVAFFQKNKHLTCPGYQTLSSSKTINKQLLPICLYCKIFS